ncbi:phosphatidate cytidylyltransferase [Aquimarina rhabdastrellae]
MKELVTRSLSGFLFVSILLFAIFFHKYSFIAVFSIFGFICIQELQRLIHFKNYWLYLIFAFLVVVFVGFTPPQYITGSLLALTLLTQVLLIRDLLTIRIIPMFEKKKYLVSIFYLISSMTFLLILPCYQGFYQPEIIAGAFLLIWTNDTFAYLTGKNFGKHKLLERISPKKTIEGFVGGFAFSLIAAYIISLYATSLSLPIWIVISIIVSFFGTLGDLIQSKFKRQAGVKDSGSLMPGHGGMFDRLDSIIFASPFLYFFLEVMKFFGQV